MCMSEYLNLIYCYTRKRILLEQETYATVLPGLTRELFLLLFLFTYTTPINRRWIKIQCYDENRSKIIKIVSPINLKYCFISHYAARSFYQNVLYFDTEIPKNRTRHICINQNAKKAD